MNSQEDWKVAQYLSLVYVMFFYLKCAPEERKFGVYSIIYTEKDA